MRKTVSYCLFRSIYWSSIFQPKYLHPLVDGKSGTYHGLGSESLDLLDGLWCTLLERDTMEL